MSMKLAGNIDVPRAPGIYRIANAVNGKVYVGATVNLRTRCAQHQRGLESGKHENRYLQAASKKYGADAFEFSVVETCCADDLPMREAHYVDLFRALERAFGYNLVPVSGTDSHFGFKYRNTVAEMKRGNKNNTGRKFTEQHKQRLSESQKGRVLTPEHIANSSAARKGKPGHPQSEKTKEKIRLANRGRSHPTMKGRKLSSETIEKIAESKRGKSLSAAHSAACSAGQTRRHQLARERRLAGDA